jgi:hypothetical protein
MRCVFACAAVFLLAGATRAEEKVKLDVAKAQLDVLDKAVAAYFVKNGEYPAKLKALVDAGFVEAKALLDPWDKEYRYDPAGKRNDGKKPDIWAVSPDKKTVGNWPKEKK